jgi:hypothetical protein
VTLPVVRRPTSLRQALWGGWTCKNCGAEVDRWGRKVGQAGHARRSWTHDDSVTAPRPAGLSLSDAKLKHLRPDLYGLWHRVGSATGLLFPFRLHVQEQLRGGNACAAVVVSVRPLRVAAHAGIFDRIAMLDFDDGLGLAEGYRLRPGSRLITANSYGREPAPDYDLFLPRDHEGPWNGLQPLIADFVTDDAGRLDALKAEIPDPEWQRTARLGEHYLRRFPGLARDGRPIHCLNSAGG